MGRKAAFLLMLLMIGATVALADSGKETTGFSAGDYVTIGRYECVFRPPCPMNPVVWKL